MVVKFSERTGIVESPKTIQVDSMNDELRNSLWNLLCTLYEQNRKHYWRMVAKHVAEFFRKSPVDEVPIQNYECMRWLKLYFYKLEWYEVYDLIEFIVNNHAIMTRESPGYEVSGRHDVKKADLLIILNQLFERELSGYRFISDLLSPIADKLEVEEIETAINLSEKLDLLGVREHIRTALELLGKKPEPDYRNAIKEAISSVESIVKLISGSNSQGIDGALDKLAQKTDIHGGLMSGFKKLYGYSSNENGIRHAILEQPSIGFAEAKYMIVSCSAFVNYLIEKADEAGLLHNQ
jgi:hypothetical protein